MSIPLYLAEPAVQNSAIVFLDIKSFNAAARQVQARVLRRSLSTTG